MDRRQSAYVLPLLLLLQTGNAYAGGAVVSSQDLAKAAEHFRDKYQYSIPYAYFTFVPSGGEVKPVLQEIYTPTFNISSQDIAFTVRGGYRLGERSSFIRLEKDGFPSPIGQLSFAGTYNISDPNLSYGSVSGHFLDGNTHWKVACDFGGCNEEFSSSSSLGKVSVERFRTSFWNARLEPKEPLLLSEGVYLMPRMGGTSEGKWSPELTFFGGKKKSFSWNVLANPHHFSVSVSFSLP
ncbi:hypothetical protein H6501_00200 [Candidatus Woesearchaeota archaeon]|nr:hypothetical protein [Candidatus Woesearchaeota archaeon]